MSKDNQPNNKEIAEPEIQNELSQVASNPKKSFAILGVAIAVLGYISYSMFFSSSTDTKPKAEQTTPTPQNVAKPETENLPVVPQIPSLPAVPKLVEPIATSQKPPEIKEPVAKATESTMPSAQPQTVGLPSLSKEMSKDDQEKAERKRKAGVMLINNPSLKPTATTEETEQEEAFKVRSNMKYLLSKGKVIDVVLETAINTDQPSEISAIVARDVFAEDGETRLIPKGSKVYGTFKNNVDDIYGIVAIQWNRINLATGYTFNFLGTSVDNLGRYGVAGRLDNKYKETITSTAISSAINVGLAQVLDKLIVPGTNTVGATKNALLSQGLSQLATTTSTSLAPKVAAKDPTALTNINNTCTQALQLFSDNTTQAYKDLSTQCTSILTSKPDADGTYTTTYTTLMTALQTASTNIATNNATTSTSNLTPTQTAVQGAVKDMSSTVKDMLTSKKYTPNVTLNQGELIRVKIDKDYLFPKNAVSNVNLLQ